MKCVCNTEVCTGIQSGVPVFLQRAVLAWIHLPGQNESLLVNHRSYVKQRYVDMGMVSLGITWQQKKSNSWDSRGKIASVWLAQKTNWETLERREVMRGACVCVCTCEIWWLSSVVWHCWLWAVKTSALRAETETKAEGGKTEWLTFRFTPIHLFHWTSFFWHTSGPLESGVSRYI